MCGCVHTRACMCVFFVCVYLCVCVCVCVCVWCGAQWRQEKYGRQTVDLIDGGGSPGAAASEIAASGGPGFSLTYDNAGVSRPGEAQTLRALWLQSGCSSLYMRLTPLASSFIVSSSTAPTLPPLSPSFTLHLPNTHRQTHTRAHKHTHKHTHTHTNIHTH